MPRRLVNERGLHKAVYESMLAGWYAGEGEDRFRSVTGLLKPPWMAALEQEHEDEIVEDAMDGIWRLMGSAMHAVIEKGATTFGVSEERMRMVIAGQVITGGSDLLWIPDGGVLTVTDFKFTGTYTYTKRDRDEEWEAQLNLYALMYGELGFDVEKGEIVLVFRDWSYGESMKRDYPPPSVTINFPIWTREKALAFAEERVRLHLDALNGKADPCTQKERWAKSTTYAVSKPKAKKALKVCKSHGEAERWMSDNAKKSKGARIETRPGVNQRCERFCVVSKWCPWYQEQQSAASMFAIQAPAESGGEESPL